jgi:hypothetical protein
MSTYISSSNNRFFAAAESAYGVAPAVLGRHRIPAVKLVARQEHERAGRRDKTGSRTYAGVPAGTRKRTSFGLNTYMTAWDGAAQEPAHGPLIAAAMGAAVQLWNGGTVASVSGTRIAFSAPHGLNPGQAVAVGGEIRFAAAVIDALTVNLNAPFEAAVAGGATAGPTATYRLATNLPSASIFDFWSPGTSVQRLLAGAAVDQFSVKVNGDFHEFQFKGGAADLIDSASFAAGQAGLQDFPAEPDSTGFDYTIIPGHLGQVWLGSVPSQFFTLTEAEIALENNIDLRNREFGSTGPRCIVPGIRRVTANLSLFAQDDTETIALYQAARQMSPVGVMVQLGRRAGQLFGVYLSSVMPEVPEFDDSESRLQWTFRECRAQGVNDDEITVAFA